MCGIWAIINRSKLTPEQIVAFQSIQPRGPDHSIIHLCKAAIFGFHRLAINDLTEKGQQPFYHIEGGYKFTAMCNGEIYNHWDLRKKHGLKIDSKSDCAVILPLFLRLKENIEELNHQLMGEYAILITKEHI